MNETKYPINTGFLSGYVKQVELGQYPTLYLSQPNSKGEAILPLGVGEPMASSLAKCVGRWMQFSIRITSNVSKDGKHFPKIYIQGYAAEPSQPAHQQPAPQYQQPAYQPPAPPINYQTEDGMPF